MKKITNIIIASLLIFACGGCDSFLDEFSQTYIRASQISDYDELLLGSVYLPSYQPNPSGGTYIYPSGSRSCDFLNMLDDDFNSVCAESYVSTGSNLIALAYSSMHNRLFGFSCWQPDITNTVLSQQVADDITWDDLYQRIAIVNTIIDEIDNMDASTEADLADKNRVTGESYFLRAQFYLILVNLYGKPYDPATAATDLGVPLKISSGVEHDKDKDTQFDRTPVAEVYDQIISDLQQAVNYLTISDKDVIYRASREAAVLLLSRVYLYTQRWQEAKDLLEPEINASTYALSSLVAGDTLGEDNYFLTEDNSEIIFSQGSLFSQLIMTGTALDFCVSHDLYSLYDDNDMRRFFFSTAATDSIALSYKFITGSQRSKVSDVLMLRNAEAYLNIAEACAMLGDASANTYLNALRSMRIQSYSAQSYSGEELVSQIRNERRKELCFEGHRWFDLRRYSVSNPYPYSKRIYRSYPFYTGSGTGNLNYIYTYVLEENDPAYVFDIPVNVKDFDTVPMPGNDRPDRPALEEQ